MSICWHNDYCVDEMNRFYDKHLKNHNMTGHLKVLTDLLSLTDGIEILDLGCGTGILSEFCGGYLYEGADLEHIIEGSAKRNYPQYKYYYFDVEKDSFLVSTISDYDVVIVNALLDVMKEPLFILDKILYSTSRYLLIHRQEITQHGKTRSILNDSYGGETYHSIINRKEFVNTVELAGFKIIAERTLSFTNWENNGNSFLLQRL